MYAYELRSMKKRDREEIAYLRTMAPPRLLLFSLETLKNLFFSLTNPI